MNYLIEGIKGDIVALGCPPVDPGYSPCNQVGCETFVPSPPTPPSCGGGGGCGGGSEGSLSICSWMR